MSGELKLVKPLGKGLSVRGSCCQLLGALLLDPVEFCLEPLQAILGGLVYWTLLGDTGVGLESLDHMLVLSVRFLQLTACVGQLHLEELDLLLAEGAILEGLVLARLACFGLLAGLLLGLQELLLKNLEALGSQGLGGSRVRLTPKGLQC